MESVVLGIVFDGQDEGLDIVDLGFLCKFLEVFIVEMFRMFL